MHFNIIFRTLLMPRMVSTSSCSTFNLAFHRKSVRATYSPWRSKVWSTRMMTKSRRNPLISRGKLGLRKLKEFFKTLFIHFLSWKMLFLYLFVNLFLLF